MLKSDWRGRRVLKIGALRKRACWFRVSRQQRTRAPVVGFFVEVVRDRCRLRDRGPRDNKN